MPRVLLCCVIWAFVAPVAVYGSQDTQPSPESRPAGSLLAEAQEKFSQRQYAEALKLATEASQIATTEELQRESKRLAVVCRLIDGREGAAEAAERLLEDFPSLAEDADLQVVLALYHAQKGNQQEAYDAYGRAGRLLEQADRHRDAWQAYLAQAEVIRRFYDVIPTGFGAEARSWSGAEQERHAIEDAVRIYEHVLKLQVAPELRAEALYRAGRTLAELGRWEFAERGIEYYRRCVEEYPDSGAASNAQYEMGQAYRKFRRYPEAVREMRKFVRHYPEHRNAPLVRQLILDITSPQLTLWTPGPVTTGEKPVIYWRSRNVETIHLTATPVDLSETLVEGECFRPGLPAERNTGGEPVAEWSFEVGDDGTHQWHICSPESSEGDLQPIEVPVESPGAYWVQASDKRDDASAACVVIIGELTTVAKADARDMVVFSTAGDDPAGEARVTTERLLYGRARTLRTSSQADENGLARTVPLEGRDRARGWLAVVRHGNQQSLCLEDEYYWQPWGWPYPWRVYGFCDRGVYGPGETVHYAQIVRAVEDGGYRTVSGKTVRVEIRDPLGRTVFTKEHETDAFGMFTGQWTPEEDAAVGDYRIGVTIDRLRVPFRDAGANIFRVVPPRQDGVWLDVRAGREFYRFGEQMEFVVTAVDADGEPMAGTDLRLGIQKEAFTPTGGGSTPDSSPAFSGGVIATDKNGRAVVTVAADGFDDDRVAAVFTVTVMHGNSVARARTRAMGKPVALSVDAASAFCLVGEDAEIRLSTHDAFGRPAEADGVTVTVSPADEPDSPVMARSLDISADGGGHVTFSPDRQGRFMVRAEADDAIPAEFELTVAPPRGAGMERLPDRLTVIPSRRECEVGETTRVLIEAPFESGPVLLTGEADKLLFSEVVRVAGGWAVTELPVGREMSPNFALVATAIRGGEVLTGKADLTVPPTDRLLDIQADVVGEGQDSHMRVKVSDRRTGRPIQARLVVVLLDGEPGVQRPSVENAFHGFTRDVQVRTFDSRDGLGKLTVRPTGSAGTRGDGRPGRAARSEVPYQEQVRLDGFAPAATLLWSGDIETDSDGLAVLPLEGVEGGKAPTAWIVAVDKAQRVGSEQFRLR
ncbi:MAG: MG2 domain-containing protein [Phycisphaerae bacterium]